MVCYVTTDCTHNIFNSFFFREISYYYKIYIIFFNLNSFHFNFLKLTLITTSNLIEIMILFMLVLNHLQGDDKKSRKTSTAFFSKFQDLNESQAKKRRIE